MEKANLKWKSKRRKKVLLCCIFVLTSILICTVWLKSFWFVSFKILNVVLFSQWKKNIFFVVVVKSFLLTSLWLFITCMCSCIFQVQSVKHSEPYCFHFETISNYHLERESEPCDFILLIFFNISQRLDPTFAENFPNSPGGWLTRRHPCRPDRKWFKPPSPHAVVWFHRPLFLHPCGDGATQGDIFSAGLTIYGWWLFTEVCFQPWCNHL